MFRVAVATLICGMVSGTVLAASADQGSAADLLATPDQIVASAMLQSVGAPARADIADQATARLSETLYIVPQEPAGRLLTVVGRPVPPDFEALLIGPEGMETPGFIRFVPAGFVAADAALAWTDDDMLASLKDTVERGNPERAKAHLQELEARRWVVPPRYDPESHQIAWAALIVPKSAPRESDGEIIYHAIGFGQDGYVELTFVTSLEKAELIRRIEDSFLAGLNFRPGKTYADAQPTDRRAPAGLAGAMGFDSLHRAEVRGSFLAGDTVVPVAGGIVAAVGALSLLVHIERHRRRNARRI